MQALDCDFSVIGLSETWLKSTNVDLYGVDGYCMEYKVREDKTGGGVAMYINDCITYKRRTDLEDVLCNEAEALFIELPCKYGVSKKPIVVAEIYRPPGGSVKDFCEKIDLCCDIIEKEGKLSYIMGDLNINLLNSVNHQATGEFLNVMHSHMLVPVITRPTRVTEYSSTLIDHIFTNVTEILECNLVTGILYCSISDHLPVFCIQQ